MMQWSHSQVAYDHVRDQLFDKAELALNDTEIAEWIQIIWAEWKATKDYELDIIEYEKQLAFAKMFSEIHGFDSLIVDIWENANEARNCDNTMHDAWICPTGCHRLPFSNGELYEE